MARIAKGRDRALTREEIAAQTLRQFDTGAEPPSIRALAAALGVAPSAIYHHFESQAAIVQAATELVWEEATRDFLAVFPDPYNEDPAEVLVAAGIATRRAFGRHYRIAPFLAASPETTEFMTELLGLLAVVFERLGLQGEGREHLLSYLRVVHHRGGALRGHQAASRTSNSASPASPAVPAAEGPTRASPERTLVARSTTRSTCRRPIPPGTRSSSPPGSVASSRASRRHTTADDLDDRTRVGMIPDNVR